MTQGSEGGWTRALSVLPLSKRMLLADLARDLDHDLGRYVYFQLAVLPPDAPRALLLKAARADVLETRKLGSHSQGAVEIFESSMRAFREQFENNSESYALFLRGPEVRGLQEHMAQLHAHSAALRDGVLDRERLLRVVQDAKRVADGTRRLHDALRELCNEVT